MSRYCNWLVWTESAGQLPAPGVCVGVWNSCVRGALLFVWEKGETTYEMCRRRVRGCMSGQEKMRAVCTVVCLGRRPYKNSFWCKFRDLGSTFSMSNDVSNAKFLPFWLNVQDIA